MSLVVSAGVAVQLPSRGAAALACDLTQPASCSLGELASRLGFRVGATAEPAETQPGPYATTLAREFNAVTPENALKWYTVQPSPGVWQFGPADTVVDFADAHGMEVRGHTLVWAQDRFTPSWVKAVTDPAVLRALVDEEIQRIMTRYAGRIHRWDVVNEPLASLGTGTSDSVFWRVLGPDWVADAFRTAHAVDPTAELWLNEYGTDWVPGKHEALVALVKGLLARGVPLHGIGLQTHRPTVAGPDPATFRAQLQEFADLGLDVAITELDVPVDPADVNGPTKQAEAYGRVMDACLTVERCREVTTWGVTDASTWLDSLGVFPTPTRPLLFDENYRPKPAYTTVHDLLARAAASAATTTAPSMTTSTSRSASTSIGARGSNAVTAAVPAAVAARVTPRFTG